MQKLVKITTDGTISTVDISDRPGPLFKKLADELGVRMIEHVNAEGLKRPYCMYVDEEGALKDKVKTNPIGSYFYGFHRHGHPIFGDILIGKNVVTSQGPDWGFFEDDQEPAIVVKAAMAAWNLKTVQMMACLNG
jgi:hypothetical protein